ncbi:MAG: citrate lyase acyl carrier protein [Gracilibacteraceae bacterium]|jgi:citrate lyase subunit gamma (acyl carrier protein)|nr:citrate lyase acyl carrier protein [Gracilibacteraceae bacterium]
MKLVREATAGASDAGDIIVTVLPGSEPGVTVELKGKSVVLKQFGTQMKAVIKKTAEDLGVESALIKAQDNAALDFTIRARTRCAIERAAG